MNFPEDAVAILVYSRIFQPCGSRSSAYSVLCIKGCGPFTLFNHLAFRFLNIDGIMLGTDRYPSTAEREEGPYNMGFNRNTSLSSIST